MANLTFPPDTACWLSQTRDGMTSFVDATAHCPGGGGHQAAITQAMVDFLNISDPTIYWQAYCINPGASDSCSFGYCPQPDVAGPLVRYSTYVSALCLATLLFYSHKPEAIREAYYAQVLTLYSIMVAAVIAVFQHNLTKFHALIAIELVASPLTIYMFLYAVRSFFHRTRLEHLMGHGKYFQRFVAIGTLGLWTAFLIYTLLPSHLQYFSQSSCDAESKVVKWVFLLPVMFLIASVMIGKPELIAIMMLPILVITTSWMVAIYRRRRHLWYRTGERRRPGFWDVWTMIGSDFPFIHFMSVCIVPFLLWVGTVELSLYGSNDNVFQATFGQVLAVFVTVPPLLSCVRLLPQCGRWFADLAWVRWVTGRRQRPPRPMQVDDMVPLADDVVPPAHPSRMGSYASTYDEMVAAQEKSGDLGRFAPAPLSGGGAQGRYVRVDLNA